jgi:hypothetical protein
MPITIDEIFNKNFEIYFTQVCTIKFVELYNLALKNEKGKHEWDKACENFNLCIRKMNIIM